MKLFLDSSVVLAGCGSAVGASRAILEGSASQNWLLQSSSYVVAEVDANIARISNAAILQWNTLRPRLQLVPDVLTHKWPTIAAPAKDRPILFTAAAWADVLLTLDRRDFTDLLGATFYGLQILRPGAFLARQRAAGRSE